MTIKQLHLKTLDRSIPLLLVSVFWLSLVLSANAQLDDTIYVWYGNVDSSPVVIDVGEQFELDIYINTGGQFVGSAFVCSGARTEFITQRLNADLGQFYYPFTSWDDAGFVNFIDYYNDSTWFSEPFNGIAQIFTDTVPYLNTTIPIRLLTEVMVASDDPSLAGQTIDAFGPGFHYTQGATNFGDTLGNNYEVVEYFSPLRFRGETSIGGTVTDQFEQPVEGVAVEISQDTDYFDTTDVNGEYLISGINPGMVQVYFSHPNYRDTIVEASATADDLTIVDLVMVSTAIGDLEGTVTDSTGLPLTDVSVSLIGTSLSSVTDSEGFYRIEGIAASSYSIRFSKPGYSDLLVNDVIISTGLTTTVDVALAVLISDVPVMNPNYPNPFNSSTKISFYLPREEQVKVIIYDILGRKIATVADMQGRAGLNIITWNGSEESAGVYFCRISYRGKDYIRSLTKF